MSKSARNWKYRVGQRGIVSEVHLDKGKLVEIYDRIGGVEEPGYIVSPVERLGKSFFWLRESELLVEAESNEPTDGN
jgi:hypothetical protein